MAEEVLTQADFGVPSWPVRRSISIEVSGNILDTDMFSLMVADALRQHANDIESGSSIAGRDRTGVLVYQVDDGRKMLSVWWGHANAESIEPLHPELGQRRER